MSISIKSAGKRNRIPRVKQSRWLLKRDLDTAFAIRTMLASLLAVALAGSPAREEILGF